MSVPSYPYYAGPLQVPWPLVPPKPLLPLLQPPEQTAPAHPARPGLPPPPAGFTRSFHAAPAAYPRSVRESVGAEHRLSTPYSAGPAPPNEDKKARSARQLKEIQNCVEKRYTGEQWSIEEAAAAKPKGLWVSAERWRRDKPVGGATLLLTHANGLPKEQWHPIIRNILARDPKSPGRQYGTGAPLAHATDVLIDEVWFLDDVTHGVSLDLNAGLIGPTQYWIDTGRDILNFVAHTLPLVQAQGGDAPWQLPWAPERSAHYADVIGIGHSFGATSLIHAVAARPDLFRALMCIESTCGPLYIPEKMWRSDPSQGFMQTAGAIKRRAVWPTRADFETGRSNPFYGTWDDEAWEIFLTHGVVPVDPAKPQGAVTLATAPWAEAAVFTEPEAVGRGWDKLLELQIPVGFLMCGAKEPIWTGGSKMTRELVWRPRLARNERIMDGGHLLVQEKPKEVADAIWRFLTTLDAGEWELQRSKL